VINEDLENGFNHKTREKAGFLYCLDHDLLISHHKVRAYFSGLIHCRLSLRVEFASPPVNPGQKAGVCWGNPLLPAAIF